MSHMFFIQWLIWESLSATNRDAINHPLPIEVDSYLMYVLLFLMR